MTFPTTMNGMILTAHGDLDTLEWRTDLPVPTLDADDVLIKVRAAAINNTDINTRIGWYSKAVRGDTASLTGSDPKEAIDTSDSSWSGAAIAFPRIQGADCCGHIIAVGSAVSEDRIGERVLVRPLQPTSADGSGFACRTFGSEVDGGFAQYTKTLSRDALVVRSEWDDVELASLPCAYATAEGMIRRVGLGEGIGDTRVLITGASGGVGSAAIQLAKRRGARITAVSTADKRTALMDVGADAVLDRADPIPPQSFDVVIDLVGGPRWPHLLEGLVPGGRYVTAGAIAGPMVELDLRTLYLRDLSMFGSTFQEIGIMEDIIRYAENNEIKPMISARYPLSDMKAAQEVFLSKAHIGKIGLIVDDS